MGAYFPMPIFADFKKAIKQYDLIHRADTIVIGVSGGPDSVCLLYLLKALEKELKLTLHIAHLNHRLRAKDSEKDAEFVLELSKKLQIPATFKEVDILKLNPKGSLEETARRGRFDFFFEVARKIHARTIALGHTMDDQAETVLMRLLRGSGLMGLSGILPKRTMGRFTIIRPLLRISRYEIERFLKAKKIKARIDASNSQEIYFRNKIRHSLLGELKKYNLNIKEVLANTAEHIALDYDFVVSKSLPAFKKVTIRKAKERITLDLKKLLKLHPALLNMVFRLSFEALKGDTRRLSFKHIQELTDLACFRRQGSIVDLPSNISAFKNSSSLSVYLR